MRVLSPDVDFQKLPIKTWCPELEDTTAKQATNLANLPFAFKHIALMPDAHMGYGMPIGGVLATKGYVIPNAVGVDIGCGMCAVKLPKSVDEGLDGNAIKYLMNMIRNAIPFGFNKHKSPVRPNEMPEPLRCGQTPIVEREYANARKSLGTLGGGNHFIEFQKGSDGHVWVMIHSGSRNLGKQVADHYNKVAVALNEKYLSSIPKSHELAFLPLDSEEAQLYLREMDYCLQFAKASRKRMMKVVVEAFYALLDMDEDCGEEIDVIHNYVRMENHYGLNVMVHRKGACSARDGEVGIIPGSQGSMSYITKGKGNVESFTSCSHGAGRKYGRKQAQKVLNLEDEIAMMDQKGIIHGIRTRDNLEEATGAYKDIEEVMDNQQDLTAPMVQLRPLASMKG